MKTKSLNKKRIRRQRRSRASIFGRAARPRLSVFRSIRSVYAQLIDDEAGKTLVSASSSELKAADLKKTKKEQSALVGALLAKRAAEAGVHEAVFDRRWYRYHGRVSALAESARKEGLKI